MSPLSPLCHITAHHISRLLSAGTSSTETSDRDLTDSKGATTDSAPSGATSSSRTAIVSCTETFLRGREVSMMTCRRLAFLEAIVCDKKDTSPYHQVKARSALFLLLFIILLVLVLLVTYVPLARSYAETAVPPAKDAKSEYCSVRVPQVGEWRAKSAPLLQKLVDPALRLLKIL